MLPDTNIVLPTFVTLAQRLCSVDPFCNIVFIHLLASVVGNKYLFHELIRYHVVESVSSNGKRIVMVNDGGLDLIYRGVLSIATLHSG